MASTFHTDRVGAAEATQTLRDAGLLVEEDRVYLYARHGSGSRFPHRLLKQNGQVSRRRVQIIVNKVKGK